MPFRSWTTERCDISAGKNQVARRRLIVKMDDMILISADDHVIEPPDLFKGRVPAKYADFAPQVVTYTNGEQRWVFEGQPLIMVASSAVAGRKREELAAEASRFSELRSGYYDVDARVEDMNANGVLSSLNFPSLPGFAGELFLRGQDKNCMLALLQAYNDWHLEHWCGSHPGRFIPLAILPLWDPDDAAAEIRRVARKGARSVCLPENPSALGLPSVHRDHWSPVLEACVEENIVVQIHIGTAGPIAFPSPDSPADWMTSMLNIQVAGSLVDWTYSPMVRRYPELRFAMSEGCIGWVPFIMERADAAYRNHRFWTKQELGDLMPSDIMRRQFLFCFHEDNVGLKNRHDLGVDLIAWECDFPHADSTWPRSPELLWEQMKDFPREEIDLITHENVMRFFSFDPFEHIPREQATVGALRAKATHVKVEPQSLGGGRMPDLDKELNVLTARAMMELQERMNDGLVPVS